MEHGSDARVLSSAGSNGEEAGRQEGGPEEDSLEKS